MQGTILKTHVGIVMNCDRYEDFWITWYDGIRIGRGIYTGVGEFLYYDGEVKHPISAASLSTGFGADGQWRWPVQRGMYY